MRKCLFCGKEISEYAHASQKYCTADCRIKAGNKRNSLSGHYSPLSVKNCEYCGKEFMQHNSLQRFCTNDCYKLSLKYRRVMVTPEINSHGERECKYCGIIFRPGRGGATCCSHDCHNKIEYLSLEARKWKPTDKPAKLHLYCEECGERFTVNGKKDTVKPKEILCPICREQVESGSVKRGSKVNQSKKRPITAPHVSQFDSLAKRAKEMGISYGKMMAMEWLREQSKGRERDEWIS